VLKMGDAGVKQPITSRPDVTLCRVDSKDADGSTVTGASASVVLFGTGRLLDLGDIANTDVQSLYVLKDSGSAISARVRGSRWKSRP
jgi:type IV pilus assembly protein PilY1